MKQMEGQVHTFMEQMDSVLGNAWGKQLRKSCDELLAKLDARSFFRNWVMDWKKELTAAATPLTNSYPVLKKSIQLSSGTVLHSALMLLLLLLLFLSLPECRGDEQATCDSTAPCSERSFCNSEQRSDGMGVCVECEWHSHFCFESDLTPEGTETCLEACRYADECSIHFECAENQYCNFDEETHGYCEDFPDPCNATTSCEEGLFCNFFEDKTGNDKSGECLECDWHSHFCFESNLTADAIDSCFEACYVPHCSHYVDAFLDVDGVNIQSIYVSGGTIGNVTGPLIDVGLALAVEDMELHVGENIIPGSVCLIERGEVTFYEKVVNCKASGGVGAVIFNNIPGEELNAVIYDADENSTIPSVTIVQEDGEGLKNNLTLGESTGIASIQLVDYGEFCSFECSVHFQCPENQFCNFDSETHGYCEECAGDSNCYFSGLPLPGAQDCAETCGGALTFDDCKLCGNEISGNTLGTALSASDTCIFCPGGLHPDYMETMVPMFGDQISCFLVDEYFRNYEISAHDTHCSIALMYNHICGCEGGTGYAGANTPSKREAFVWLPRCTAILSFMGSSIIIFDIIRSKMKRSKMNNQMMAALSLFDLLGSAAYALTSLPTPLDEGIDGAQGNDATCLAQGFFIQIGSIAAYLNVSLSVYYLFVIKLHWNEAKLKKYRPCFFACPIAIGLAFAFAGIPFYTNSILWCNNGARWWPEIPVILAIFIVTLTMTIVCSHVYEEEKASVRWRGTSNNKVSRAVFWQSVWYLMNFYMTWPPYLALQYLWSSGRAYSMYGFVLFAGTLVTLQGFWNFVAFKRREIKKQIYSVAETITFRFSTSRSSALSSASTNIARQTASSVKDLMKSPEREGEGEVDISSANESTEKEIVEGLQVENGCDDGDEDDGTK